MADFHIERVDDTDSETIELVRTLFLEYHAWLGAVVCSHRLAEEIAELPGPYASPSGRLWLARGAREGLPSALGMIGVRRHDERRCEVKRLYVRPEGRGLGVGRALLDTALAEAVGMGYREALVTTLPSVMPVAREMYARIGFVGTEPFMDHTLEDGPDVEYLRLTLG